MSSPSPRLASLNALLRPVRAVKNGGGHRQVAIRRAKEAVQLATSNPSHSEAMEWEARWHFERAVAFQEREAARAAA